MFASTSCHEAHPRAVLLGGTGRSAQALARDVPALLQRWRLASVDIDYEVDDRRLAQDEARHD